jgi:hypothetical protein
MVGIPHRKLEPPLTRATVWSGGSSPQTNVIGAPSIPLFSSPNVERFRLGFSVLLLGFGRSPVVLRRASADAAVDIRDEDDVPQTV